MKKSNSQRSKFLDWVGHVFFFIFISQCTPQRADTVAAESGWNPDLDDMCVCLLLYACLK